MDPGHWKKIKAAFNEAVELDTAERERFLRGGSGVDAEILAEVRRLVHAERTDRFGTPAADISHIWQGSDLPDLVGLQIGPYTILREIGHGGMGVVFEAGRDLADFSQTVALKLLKRGMDSEAMLRRFRHERQILASLEHPNIARLMDGGMTADGTPYLAMEFVIGQPLDAYCNERSLTIHQRLDLFLQICSAVSFAHSRLVVHRDLKPNNILVTADRTVKLLDFGIAKLISADGDEGTHTVTTLGMMTPAYASPEQVRGDIVSTASDIYSLGLILFETLTGSAAYSLPSNRPDEIARVICEVDPPRPSSVVSVRWTPAEKSETNKGKDATTLRPQMQDLRPLKGDLDTIILKALRKDPDRRYASVEQFAGDIRRHLAGLTVIARPDTFSYRFEKFVSRNRGYVAAGLLVLLTLIGGIGATAWQAVRADQQRQVSEQRFKQVRELANNIVFKYYDEAEKLPNSTKLREMLVNDSLNYFDSLAADASADDLLDSELALAYIRVGKVMGRAYFANLGDVAGAITNYKKGITLLEPLALKSVDAKLKVDLINAYSELATALRRQGSVGESDQLLHKAIDFNEQLVRAAPDDVTMSLRLVTLYLYLGDSLPVGTGENENIMAYRRSVELCETILNRDPNHVRANNILAAAADRIATNLTILAHDAAEDENPELAKQLQHEAVTIGAANLEITKKILVLQPEEVLNAALLNATIFNYGTYEFESGDAQNGLRDQTSAEREFRTEFENDPNNLENKLLLSSVLSALSTTQMRIGHVPDAQKAYDEAVSILDKLIAADAANFDYQQKRWEAKFAFADELLLRGDAEKAKAVYGNAANEIDKIAHEKDAGYGASLRGFYLVRIGNVNANLAKKTASAQRRRELLESARQQFTEALATWRQFGAQSILGISQPNKVAVLEKRIARTSI